MPNQIKIPAAVNFNHVELNLSVPVAPEFQDDNFDAENDDDHYDDGHDGDDEEDEPQPVFKKKKMIGNMELDHPFPFPHSKTQHPGHLSREELFKRARQVARPTRHQASDSQCMQCSCRLSQHGAGNKKHEHCGRCEGCPGGFLYVEQVNRVYFTQYLHWVRRWLKAGKKRDIKRFREIWARFRNLGRLHYCGTCDTPTFNNELHGIAKRQEGLQCASCRQCSSCCKCVSCDKCRRRKYDKQICKTCNVCNQCCQCKECPVCNRDCSHNYCGYAFTDYQKRHSPGCQRCYKCCDCGDYKKVPFGSFAKPVFHKPNLKQHSLNPTSRYIAAEIECAGIHGLGFSIYETARRWGGGTVGDGSLHHRGFEINTAPAGGDLYPQQIEELCAAIKKQNGYLDQKCGLHVHVDARDMNYYDIRRFVRAYAACEDALFSMVSPQRIQGVMDDKGELHQYCQPCGKKYVSAIEEGRLPYDKIKSDIITSVYSSSSTQNLRHRKRGQGIPRYNALNLHSWFFRGTIEARMFDGCIEPDPIIKWGILWALIADYVVKSSDEQVAADMVGKPLACLKKIIGGNKNILDFVKARVLMFGDGQAKREANELF